MYQVRASSNSSPWEFHAILKLHAWISSLLQGKRKISNCQLLNPSKLVQSLFRAQHGCDTLAWSEPSSYTGAVKQWRWRSFIYFFTNIFHVIPHVIYVKILKLSLGRSLCTRQDLGCPPMCGQGQGFATKRATFGERGIILHIRQVETSSRALKILAMESISHLQPLHGIHAMLCMIYAIES